MRNDYLTMMLGKKDSDMVSCSEKRRAVHEYGLPLGVLAKPMMTFKELSEIVEQNKYTEKPQSTIDLEKESEQFF